MLAQNLSTYDNEQPERNALVSLKLGTAYNELTTSEMVTDRITKPVKFCMFYFISIFGIYLHTLYQLAVAMSANVFQAFWLLGRFERSA